MSQKWNLQDIQPSQPRRRSNRPVDPIKRERPPEVDSRDEADAAMSITIKDGKHKSKKSLFVALFLFVAIVGAGLLVSALMAGAEVTVYPKHREPTVNALFAAHLTPQADELTYEIMTLEAEGERQVTASGQQEVQSQAEGSILIYNKHQSDPIRLVTNTRFESPDGLIYKIKNPAVIPGYTTDSSGAIVPGVVTAEVFADEVGEQYNIGPSRFTIPGFAGEPEFDNLYAESTEVMSGGFDGLQFIIDEAELKTAQQALRMELRNSLLDRIESEKPAGFLLFDGAITFTYVSLPSVEFGDNLATIREKVLMRIPLFEEQAFANYLAAASIPGYEGEPVRIADHTTLSFEYEQATTTSTDISQLQQLDFNLNGRPQIIWEYDEGKLKTDLLNVNKTALPNVLSGYPAITRAEAVVRPFWKTRFPTNLAEIEIIELIGEDG